MKTTNSTNAAARSAITPLAWVEHVLLSAPTVIMLLTILDLSTNYLIGLRLSILTHGVKSVHTQYVALLTGLVLFEDCRSLRIEL